MFLILTNSVLFVLQVSRLFYERFVIITMKYFYIFYSASSRRYPQWIHFMKFFFFCFAKIDFFFYYFSILHKRIAPKGNKHIYLITIKWHEKGTLTQIKSSIELWTDNYIYTIKKYKFFGFKLLKNWWKTVFFLFLIR